jgi:hypothetical protein
MVYMVTWYEGMIFYRFVDGAVAAAVIPASLPFHAYDSCGSCVLLVVRNNYAVNMLSDRMVWMEIGVICSYYISIC